MRAAASLHHDVVVRLTPRQRCACDLTTEVVENEPPCVFLHLRRHVLELQIRGPVRQRSRFVHESFLWCDDSTAAALDETHQVVAPTARLACARRALPFSSASINAGTSSR